MNIFRVFSVFVTVEPLENKDYVNASIVVTYAFVESTNIKNKFLSLRIEGYPCTVQIGNKINKEDIIFKTSSYDRMFKFVSNFNKEKNLKESK